MTLNRFMARELIRRAYAMLEHMPGPVCEFCGVRFGNEHKPDCVRAAWLADAKPHI